MLRIHFLNVGHGDCTVLGHPSGRLTMIDINNSQDYDPDSFKELEEEERQKTGGGGLGLGALSLGGSALSANAASDLGLGGVGALSGLLAGYAATKLAHDAAAQEIADPIAFMRNTYTRQSLWRFVLTHPDLDHMRGLKNLHETIGFANFWDTDHVKPTPDFKNDSDRKDWEFYQAQRQGQVSGVNICKFTRGSSAFAFAREENGLPGGDN